jgi:hypothetical protein
VENWREKKQGKFELPKATYCTEKSNGTSYASTCAYKNCRRGKSFGELDKISSRRDHFVIVTSIGTFGQVWNMYIVPSSMHLEKGRHHRLHMASIFLLPTLLMYLLLNYFATRV